MGKKLAFFAYGYYSYYMKAFLVILTMFVTGITNSVYAAGSQQEGSETTSGIIDAITEFIQSFFGDDDGKNVPDKGNNNNRDKDKNVNNGEPVPVMEETPSSAEFIAARIAADTGWAKEEMIPYSTRLAKTLSQLSAKEQSEVFYGSD
jgi:hypothetical protein